MDCRFTLLAAVAALFFVTGCSTEDNLGAESTYGAHEPLTKSGSLIVSKDDTPNIAFTEDMLTMWLQELKGDCKYKVESIKGSTPSSCNNTIMYLVNFEDGGWMIFAGHVRKVNQILAYSNEGQFIPEHIKSPEVRCWYETTRIQMESVELAKARTSTAESSLSNIIDSNEQFYWVRFPYSTEYSIIGRSSTGHLTTTRWGQSSPWNIMTPNPYGNQYCYTGCTAVACSQILYYLKMVCGFDIWISDVSGAFSYSNPLLNDRDYYYITEIIRSNTTLNLSKWEGMKQYASDSGNASTVAELMFDVSARAGMRYYRDGSAANATTSLFNAYGVESDSGNYDYETVKSSLNASRPVVITCWKDDGHSHAWVIDGYYAERHDVDHSYQWKIIPTDSLRFYSNVNYDYVLTDRQMQNNYPGIEEGDIVHEHEYYINQHLLMNWGWDGYYDNGYYSISSDWTVNGSRYHRNPQILYNFRQ